MAVLRGRRNSLNNIVKMISRTKSAISRELKRNIPHTYDVDLSHKTNQRA